MYGIQYITIVSVWKFKQKIEFGLELRNKFFPDLLTSERPKPSLIDTKLTERLVFYFCVFY